MKILFAASVAAATLFAVSAPAQAQNWSAAAAQDIQGVHDSLRDNTAQPYVDRDSATFRSWLDTGAAQAKALDLSKISNAYGYTYALRAYTGGFRDSSIKVIPNWAPAPYWYSLTWPGFATAWRNGAYVVAYSDPGAKKLPPVGAQLVSCDKKPAAAIAKERLDRYEGDLNLESDRFKTAPYLLWDRANPFVGQVPLKCDFLVGKSKKSYTITPSLGGEAQRKEAFTAAAPKPTNLALESFGQGGFWIDMHDLEENADWAGLLAQIETQRDAIRAAPVVVLDLRGATSGASLRGYSVLNRLWDPEFVKSKQPTSATVAYRVSPANRQFYADAVARLQADPQYADSVPHWQDHLAKFDAALAAGQPLLQVSEGTQPSANVPANPMQGKVIILTDYWCSAGCIDVVDIARALPNTIHAGTATSADTIYIGQLDTRLPSGLARIGYGDKAWVDRQRPSNTPFTPAQVYTGNLADEAALRAWVAGL